MDTVIIVLGPTASGKTKIAIELAKEFHGEIVSADSMQVYKFMDIGTAKPDVEEQQGIKHYLIDEVNPDEEFSVARYQQLALNYIDEIIGKGKIPIVAGGTGLYINSLVYNINYTETISDWDLREKLKNEAEEKGNEYLHNRLKEIDPEAANKIHANDTKRVIRAIEVFEFTKKPISYHQEISRSSPPKYKFVIIGLRMDREKLYDRINRRVDIMIEKGLLSEIERLVEMGYDRSAVAMQGLGYKEILSFIRGEISLENAIDTIKMDTRRYAKRQMTWFRRNENVHWVDVDQYRDTSEILKNIKDYIETF